MATMTIRCDEKDKREAARVAEYYGFDSLLGHPRILEADGAHWTQSPLDLGNEEPNEESLAAIREAEQMMRDGSARELRNRPRAYRRGARIVSALKAKYHVANMGDWLLIWSSDASYAYFERTGTHEELFR